MTLPLSGKQMLVNGRDVEWEPQIFESCLGNGPLSSCSWTESMNLRIKIYEEIKKKKKKNEQLHLTSGENKVKEG